MTSPAWALLKRELTATLRNPGAFATLAAMLGICIAIVALLWPNSAVTYSGVGAQARTILRMFFLAHLMVATVLPPGLAALAFTEERRQDTLDQLRLSLVTTGGLVGAKLLAAVALFVLLFVASLPCLGVQLLLVGVSAGEILGFIAVTLSTVFMGAAMGILCAMVFRRPTTALAMSYLGMTFVLGGWIAIILAPVLVASLAFFGGNVNQCLDALPGSRALAPLFTHVWHAVFDSYDYTLNGGTYFSNLAWDGVAYRSVITALCILFAVLLGRRSTEPAAQTARNLLDEPAVLRARHRRFPFYLIDPLRRKPPIPDGVNPVLMREWRHSLGRRPQVAVRAFVLTALVLAALNIGMAWGNPQSQWAYEDALRVALVSEIAVMLLVVQVVAAGAFAREREQKGTDFLHTSLLSSTSIFWGQFGGGALAALPYLAGATVAFLASLAAIPFGLSKAPMLLGGFAAMLTCVWLTLCVSYFVSGFVKSTASAMAAGLMANLVVYLWPFLGIAWCESSLSWFPRYPIERFFEQLSPLVALCAFRWRIQGGSAVGHIHELSIEGDLYIVLAAFVAVGFLLMVNAKSRLERGGLRG